MSHPPVTNGPAFSVLSALNARVRAEFSEREPDGYWHPSSLFGCPRKTIYESRGTPREEDPGAERGMRVFRVGHQLHEYIQGAVNDDPRVLAAFDEVKITDEELGITGSLDHVVFIWAGPLEQSPAEYDGATGARLPMPPAQLFAIIAAVPHWVRVEILEYKTINSNAFKYKDLPKPDHVGQLSVYLDVLARKGGIASDGTVIPPTDARGRIAYVSKDDLLIEEFTVLLTEGKRREIRRRVAYLDSYAAHGTALPPRLPDEVKKGKSTRAYLCNYCPFQRRCWDVDGPGEEITGGTSARSN